MQHMAALLPGDDEGWRALANRELTIVIPAYRCAKYLRAAAESALHAPAAKVIIAHDGGRETLKTALTLEHENRGRVRVITSGTTRGSARNLNYATSHVETPYFAKLDGGDVLLPGFIQSAFPVIASRSGLAVVAGHELRVEPDEVLEFQAELLPRARSISQLRLMAGSEAYRFILKWSPNPCSSGAIYRTEAFRAVGGFDEQISWGEDWEIWLRFAKQWEVAYTHTASAMCRIHAQSRTSAGVANNRLCYGYDAVYRRAAEICDDPEVLPLIRRAFFGVAKSYVGAASREARHSRKESLTRCRLAWRAISTAMAL